MYKVKVHLKNGTTIEMKVDDLSWKQDASGGFIDLEWTNSRKPKTVLNAIDLREVVAITSTR